MRQIRLFEFGGPEVLVAHDVGDPAPAAGQGLVEIAAAAVNPTDLAARAGHFMAVAAPPLPFTPGWDLAGVVVDLGEGVDGLSVGDEVVGIIPWHEAGGAFGAYAERAVLQADWLVPRPEALDPLEAATIPLSAITAVQLLDVLEAPPGETIVVTGGTGAVGSFVVKMANTAGFYVIAQSGRHDEEWAHELGADEVLPRDVDFAELEPQRYMIDCVPLGTTALGAVLDAGRVVTVRPTPDPPRRIDRRFHLIRSDREVLRQVVNASAAGKLRTRIARVLPLNLGSEAHQIVEAGGLGGKVVLRPDRPD